MDTGRAVLSSASDDAADHDVRAADLQEEMTEQRFSVPSDPTKTAAIRRTSQRAEASNQTQRDCASSSQKNRLADMDDRSGVAVVGSINADLAAFGSPLPRPGETVIGTDFSLVLGGKGANQAIAAVRAGAPTYMIGAVGEDMFRDLTLATLTAEGVNVSAVRITDGATGIAHIRVDAVSGQNDIMIIPNANHQLTPDDVEVSLRELHDRVSVVLVQLEIPLSVVQRVAEVCEASDMRLVLDPAPAQPIPSAVWPGVSVVKPNELEAEVLTGIPVTDRSSAEQAGRWFLDRGASMAMITLGERGALIIGTDGLEEYPAFPVTPVDTTAAGDAFSGAFGASLASGAALPDAVRQGLAAGALAVTVRGASPSLPTAEAIGTFLAAQP
jgi:ribokinase